MPSPAPIVKGNPLTSFQEIAGSGAIAWHTQAHHLAADAIYGDETVTQEFSMLTSDVRAYIAAHVVLNQQHPTETACYLKDVTIKPLDSANCVVELVYRTETNTGIASGEIQYEMDVGVATSPIELNPYFASLTDADLQAVQQQIDDPTASVTLSSLAQELYTDRLKGVENYYVPVPIFRKTTGQSQTTLTFAFGNIGKTEMPPDPTATLPGSAVNWLKTSYRVSKHNMVWAQVEEWSYSADGWDASRLLGKRA